MTSFFDLPVVIIFEIVSHVEDRDLLRLEACCKKLREILNRPTLYKKRCLDRFGKRFERNMNGIYTMDETDLSWKTKFFLSKFFPTHLSKSGLNNEIDHEDQLKLTNVNNNNLNVLSDKPFISCNPILFKIIPKHLIDKFFFAGLEYFEMQVIDYKPTFNKAVGLDIFFLKFAIKKILYVAIKILNLFLLFFFIFFLQL